MSAALWHVMGLLDSPESQKLREQHRVVSFRMFVVLTAEPPTERSDARSALSTAATPPHGNPIFTAPPATTTG